MSAKFTFASLIILICVIITQEYEVIASVNKTKSLTDKDDGKGSLVFVFDTTGSMFNDLRQLRAGAEMILNTALEESNVIADFVFVPFHDPAVGPPTVTKYKKVFKSALNIVDVYGGGDCPEMSLTGILMALNVSRPRSFVYVFTDATAADHKLVGKVLDSIQRKQSQVVFVLTGHCNDLHKPSYKVYQQVAAASSGQVFHLNKSNVHKVLDFVRSSIKGRSVNLGSVVHPAGNYTHEIPVDKSVAEVTVSISGAKPHIQVLNPRGEITGPPQLVTTLDLSEIMIVKVLQPEPGNWSITVGSEQEHSVKVVGLSNLTFQHGFSVSPPKSLEETSYRPLKGVYSHLVISLSELIPSLQMERVQLLGLDGKPLFEVPLKRLDEKSYVAQAFVPPENFFNIAIFGNDEFGQEVRRVSPTAVQAKSPDPPVLTVPQKVMSRTHERVVLECVAKSVVPQTVAWKRDAAPLASPDNAHNSKTIEYVIEDMSEGDIGEYNCVARNSAGQSRAKTIVDLIIDPPQVNITAVESILEHEDLTISCSIFSEALLQRTQIIFNGTLQSFAIDIDLEPTMNGYYSFSKTFRNVSEMDSGEYSCAASNRAGYTNKSINFIIKLQPIAKIQGSPSIIKSINSDIQLICDIKNAKKVEWRHNNNIVKTYDVDDKAVLDVKNVTEDGDWTCTALRDNNNSSDTIKLIVHVKPLVNIESSKNITVLNGTIHSLNCKVVAKPEPRISWRMNTEKSFTTLVVNPEPNVYKSVLQLDSQKESINGTYFCTAENTEGINEDSVFVNVRRKMTVVKGFTDTLVELYSKIEFNCDIDADPFPQISWYHNNTRIYNNDNIDLPDNNTVVNIHKIDFDDLGIYECRAENDYENMTISGNLAVHGLEKPVLNKNPSKIVTHEGKETTITCRIEKGNPEPNILWQYKENSEDFSSLPKTLSVKEQGKLVIAHTKKNNAGIYRCIAENIIGKDFYDVELIVQYPPELNISQLTHLEGPIEVKSFDKIKLSCNVSGIPPPMITWTKDDLPVTYSSHKYLTKDNSVVIPNTSVFDAGVYRCNASSALGFITKDFIVAVYDPPKITTKAPDQALEVIEGELVELPCTATGSPPPALSWLHHDQKVEERRIYVDEYGLRFVANVTDFGNYTCLASNLYGNASLNYTVYIWVPPSIKPPLEVYQEIQTGSNVHLKCDAVGFPLPIMMWEFQEEILNENTTDLSSDYTGNLYINNASSKHDGPYVCVAENIAGIAKKIFFLAVNEAPKILEDNYTGPYIASNMDITLVVPCKATGKPRPYIAWIKDGYYLDKDNRYDIDTDGTLTIKEPSEDLSGVYTCIAKNSAGNITRDVSVEIYSLPVVLQEESSPTITTTVEGSSIELHCPASNGDTVKWYKDAKLISNGTLIFSNVSRKDDDTYACVVSNVVGSVHTHVVLKVQWPPTLSNSNEEIEAIRGSDYYFDCKTDARPLAKTKWLFNSKPIFGEDKQVLKIMNVQLRHSGMYECIARNEHGTARKRYNFNVLEQPFISDFDLLEVHLKSGANATLECVAKGFPKPSISWTVNNTNWIIQNATLTTSNATQQSQGEYRCDATNKAGHARLVYRVVVVSSAVIDNIVLFVDGQGADVNESVDLTLGTKVRLACKASGSPSPTIQWIRYGNSVSQNKEGIAYADLEFKSVATSDNGEYICVASNEIDIQEKKIKVNVLESPRIFQTLFHNANHSQNEINIEVISGRAFYLHCHPNGNPHPEIYWFKDDLPLKFYDDTMVSTDFSEIVVSKSAKHDQSGNYTCVARNKVGEAKVTYLVNILVPPPQLKDSIKQANVFMNSTLNLTCPVEGRPTPYVMWLKHPYKKIVDTPRVKLLDDNYTLIITETEISDSGKYSCIMTNKVGTTELIFDVVIQKPPSITGYVGNNTIKEHIVDLSKSIVLKCDADGNPPPKITWYKDIQLINEGQPNVQNVGGSSLIALWSVTTTDAGPYVCVAENIAGTANKRHFLKVKVPGKWSSWSQWSFCNVTCGLGYQRRSRRCQYIDDNNIIIDIISQPDKIILDESACKGVTNDRRKCHMPPCEEDADIRDRWSSWSKWGVCSASCGTGTQARTRRCRGETCVGDNVQIRKCPSLPRCRVNREKITEFYGSGDAEDLNLDYTPEATFEMDPEPNIFTESDNMDDYFIGPESAEPFYYDVNVTNNIDKSDPGPCEAGYRYNLENYSCEDIDECVFDKNQCHLTQVCTNTLGAYRCSCPPGYNSLGAGQRCLDINECAMNTHKCEYACVNAAGGHVCACPPHLRLHADRHHCVDPSSYRKPYFYEDIIDEEYLTTSIENSSRKRRRH